MNNKSNREGKLQCFLHSLWKVIESYSILNFQWPLILNVDVKQVEPFNILNFEWWCWYHVDS